MFSIFDLLIFTYIVRKDFKSRQSSESYICWNRTVIVYFRTLRTKVIIKQLCFYQKWVKSWLPTKNGSISGILVPFKYVFSIWVFLRWRQCTPECMIRLEWVATIRSMLAEEYSKICVGSIITCFRSIDEFK